MHCNMSVMHFACVLCVRVQLCDFDSREAMQAAVDAIEQSREELIAVGNEFCESMKKRGGGVVSVHAHIVEPRRARSHQAFGFVVVHIDVRWRGCVVFM